MKKFLSSLLALTMILSLVIVPANANEATVTGATVTGKSDLTLNETTEYSVSLAGAKAGNADISSDASVTYNWTVSDDLEITGDGEGTQATVSVKA